MRTILLLAALCAAVPLPAQPCGTPTISLVLRDARGVNVPTDVSQVHLTPAKGILAPYRFSADEVSPGAEADSVHVLRLWGDRCRVWLGEMAVRRGGEEMRLLACVRVRAWAGRRSIHLVIDTPPFRPGRWVLADARLPRASTGFMWMDAGRWTRQEGVKGAGGARRACGARRRTGSGLPKTSARP